MIKHYLQLAFRNFKRRAGHAFINITGLAIAIAACLLIGIYIQYELSYDDFLDKEDRIYRITQTSITPDKTYTSARTVMPLAPTMQAEYARFIESTVRFFNGFALNWTFIIRSGNSKKPVANSFLESDFYFVDSTFFEVFSFDLIRGNPATALDKPLSLILTPQKARKFFGTEKAIGKTITLETGSMKMTVTGIMEPVPPNSHLKVDILASFSSLNILYEDPKGFYDDWFVNNVWTYVLLKKGVQPEALSAQFSRFSKKYYASSRNKSETLKLNLQPVERIHLYSHLDGEMQPNGSIFNIYLLATAAILLLIIAGINFVNLATARASERSREVGMRKALGADRRQLISQFMGESFLLTFIAFVTAVVLVLLAIPLFNNIVDAQLVFNPFQNIPLLLGVIILFIILGIFAGFYPALYLSGFQSREIMQQGSSAGGGSMLRKGLVVVQFALSVMLVIGSVIVFLQLQYMQQKKLGFNKERLVIMPISQTLTAWEFPSFKKRAEQSSAILSVTGISKILGTVSQDSWKIAPVGDAGSQGETNFALWVTQDFIEAFDMEVIAGRGFSKKFSTDADNGLLINQKMVRELGYDKPRKALGSLFYFTTTQGEKKPLRVIGVVQDFHYTSIEKVIKPTVICLANDLRMIVGTINYAVAEIAPHRMKDGLAHLKKVWEEVNYIDPFSYSLQTKKLAKVSASEKTTGTVMRIFTILCIIVACLGLFGLASFTVSKRTKEIGIRKSLGASTENILVLLNSQYLKLVLIANVIAWPAIYFLARQWLQDFPYRIDLGWNVVLIFAAVAVLTLLICFATVSYQSVKAASVNPVNSLQSE